VSDTTGGGAAGRRPRTTGLWYALRKVLSSVLTLLFVAVFNFFLFQVLPGDPAKAFAPRGRNSDPEALAALRRSYGSGLSLWETFVRYLDRMAHLDFGVSYSQHAEVTKVIGERLWPTVLLSGTALLISAGLGVWLGARSGWRHGSRFDRTASSTAVTAYSMPEWWLGLILIFIFASSGPLSILPLTGMRDPRSTLPGWLDVAWHLVLPVMSLAVVYVAEYSLIMRSSILDERYSEYLSVARAKGLREDLVLRRHALPNALLPSITLFMMSLGFVVSGAITVETIFNWPGLGLLTAEAVRGPDVPLLQGVFVVFSAGVILMNLVADLLYPLLDPRVRRS
jgi:peptide/nickel transport system permease protein